MHSAKYKLLFIHNSLPEYRLEFWRELGKILDVEILITNKLLARDVYGFDYDTSALSVSYFYDIAERFNIESYLTQYDAVILPPVDSFYDFRIAVKFASYCKKKCIPYYYWSEKWEPSKNEQPFMKKIKNYIHGYMIKFASKKCTSYLASGTKVKEYLLSLGIRDKNISIAYDSSISPQPEALVNIREKYSIPKDSLIILYLGRLISRKGCKFLIQAFKKININQCYLLIAGTGEQEIELQHLSKGMTNVLFCGKIQPSERKNYYLQSNVFVLPSIVEKGVIEAWGLTLNEALECGTPIITTYAVGAGYDLIDNNVGFQIEPGNVEALCKALNASLCGCFDRQKCKERYEIFSVPKMARQFADVIINGINKV